MINDKDIKKDIEGLHNLFKKKERYNKFKDTVHLTEGCHKWKKLEFLKEAVLSLTTTLRWMNCKTATTALQW